jgi:hypothetical protein
MPHLNFCFFRALTDTTLISLSHSHTEREREREREREEREREKKKGYTRKKVRNRGGKEIEKGLMERVGVREREPRVCQVYAHNVTVATRIEVSRMKIFLFYLFLQ